MASEHIFNPELPTLGDKLEKPTRSELENIRCFKYADYDYVWRQCDNDYVKYVLESIPIMGRHNNILIDVKIHDLEPGDVACMPGWHLDGSINPNGTSKQPEILTLFVTGAYARTEFLAQPIVLSVEDKWDFAVMSMQCAKMIPGNHPIWSIPSCQFATYGDHHFHRGKPASGKERRLLIRTTETDIIQPQNHIYTPYTHKV